jgi:hypothetical protein
MSESFSCSISVAYSSLGVTKVDHMCLEMGGLIPFLPCKPAPNKLYNVRLSALLYQIFNVNIASSISCYTEMDGTNTYGLPSLHQDYYMLRKYYS